MITKYQIRNAKLDGIMIDFDSEHEAMRWWRENSEHAPVTDTRHGAVVVRSTWETHQEAETARLDFMLGEGSIAAFSRACLDVDHTSGEWLKTARTAIDIARKAPADTVVVIWPNAVVSHAAPEPHPLDPSQPVGTTRPR